MTAPTAVYETAPRRRRRRWPWVVLIILVLVAALVVAAEVIARAVVPEVARAQVVAALDLPPGQEVAVETPGLLLPQLAAGRLDTVHLTSESVTIGPLTGTVDLTATGVPLDGGAMTGAEGVARIPAEQLRELLAASDLPLDAVLLEEGTVTLEGSVRVFGIAIPLAVGVEPGVAGGELQLLPVSFRIGGAEVDAQELARRLGSLGEELAGPYPVCLSDRMPAGISLTSIAVDGGEAEVGFTIDGRITVDEALQQPGVCP